MDAKIKHSPSPALHKQHKTREGLEQSCSHGLLLLPRDTRVAWSSDAPQGANFSAPKAPKATPLLCSTAEEGALWM